MVPRLKSVQQKKRVPVACNGYAHDMVLRVLHRGLLQDDLAEKDAWRMYREDYGDEPFVRLVRASRGIHRYPEPKILSGANYCDIGFVADPHARRLVVIAAIDNLMKGAAGNAVQTANVMMGWPERLGLEFPGLHPV